MWSNGASSGSRNFGEGDGQETGNISGGHNFYDYIFKGHTIREVTVDTIV